MAAREAADPVMKPNWVSRPGLAPNEPAQLRILDTPDDAFHLTSIPVRPRVSPPRTAIPYPVVGYDMYGNWHVNTARRAYVKMEMDDGEFVRPAGLIGLQCRDETQLRDVEIAFEEEEGESREEWWWEKGEGRRIIWIM